MGCPPALKNPKDLTVENLVELLAQQRTGGLAPEDQEFVKRGLARYRARYLAGQLSDRAAQRLGLLDAQS
jgi:hypothetical protein